MKTIFACSTAALVALATALVFSPIRVRGQNTAKASKPSEASNKNVENGKRIYIKYGCYQCHGYEGQGGNAGSRLGPDTIPLEIFISYTRKPTGEMPPYTDKVVSDRELADMLAFLQSRPHPPVAKTIPLLK